MKKNVTPLEKKQITQEEESGTYTDYAGVVQATVKQMTGDKKGAIEYLNNILLRDPRNGLAYFERGIAKDETGDRHGALRDIDVAIDLLPEESMIYYSRGVVKSGLNDLTGAINDYNKSIQLDSKYALAFQGRGNAKVKLGQMYEAQKDYLRVIYLNDEYVLLNNLHQTLRRYSIDYSAPFIVKHLTELFPHIKTHTSTYDIVQDNNKKCNFALTWLAYQDATLHLNSQDANRLLMFLCFGMGDPIHAIKYIEEAIKNDKSDLSNYYWYLRCAESIIHDDYKKISELATIFVQYFFDYGEEDERQWFYAGRIMQQLGDIKEAIDCYKEASNFWPAQYAEFGLNGKNVNSFEDFSLGLNKFVVEPNSDRWLSILEKAILFYDLEFEITLCEGIGSQYPRFFELFSINELIEPLRKHEIEHREEWLKKVFEYKMENIYDNINSDPNRFYHDLSVKNAFESLLKSNNLEFDLSLYASSKDWQTEEVSALIEYFYLNKLLTVDSFFYLYFYVIKCRHVNLKELNEGTGEAIKVLVEKTLSAIFKLTSIFGEAAAAGVGEALKVLFVIFLQNNPQRIPKENGPTQYEQFKEAFKSEIHSTYELLGEDVFFKRYPIKGFDNF